MPGITGDPYPVYRQVLFPVTAFTLVRFELYLTKIIALEKKEPPNWNHLIMDHCQFSYDRFLYYSSYI